MEILLVDDNPIELQGIHFLIDKSGIQANVTNATNGEDALAMLRIKPFQILLTDIKMPMMDGVELIKRVRDFDQDIRIVIISGYDDFNYARSLLPFNVEDYILKPVNAVQLLAVLRDVIGQVRGNQEGSRMPVINAALAIIHNDYAEALTLENLAARVFLSPSYLSSLFKKETGVGFNKYLNDLRLDRAVQLLQGSNMKVADIAGHVGIENVPYFNWLFKKEYGMTPFGLPATGISPCLGGG